MIFEENKIICMCDSFFTEGVPVGIDFEVLDIGTSYKLVAPGYGGYPYGSGAVFVKKAHIGDYAKVLVDTAVKEVL